MLLFFSIEILIYSTYIIVLSLSLRGGHVYVDTSTDTYFPRVLSYKL